MLSPRFLLGLVCAALLGAPADGVATDLALRVMTFNLRFASPQPPHAWPDRRPVMRDLLQREAPDIIGTQEGVYPQLRDIAADLPDYEWIGLGRAGGSRDEFCAIFFRRSRFEPVAFDHFWLSDTPDLVGSMTWGNRYRRMVTWVRLRERATGREIEVWNTHFDHEVELARENSALLLSERLAHVDPAMPLIVLGDFNAPAGAGRVHDILTRDASLADTWTLARERENEGYNTFHDYQPPARAGERIDWILARPPVEVVRTAIVTFPGEGQMPSDHFPVTAELRFPSQN